MKKNSYLASFLLISAMLSPLFCKTLAGAEQGDILEINHIAKVPNGREYVLGKETISNLTDIYYYSPEQSPVASSFLGSGYELSDEKNKLIEADVVENNGKMDLYYTPSLKDVKVTYYKDENGKLTEMGSITDSAYYGETYTPLLPVHEDNVQYDVLSVDNETHLVGNKNNDFKVTYSVAESKDETPAEVLAENDASYGQEVFSDPNDAKGATLSQYGLNRNKKYIYGYPDNTFRPNDKITKREVFQLLYSLGGGFFNILENKEEVLLNLRGRGVLLENDENKLNDLVTWKELVGYVRRFNDSLANTDRAKNLESDYWAYYFEKDREISRAETVAIINEMYERDEAAVPVMAQTEFSDVYEDFWAYNDIIKASN